MELTVAGSSFAESIVQIFISDDNGDPPEMLKGPIASVQQSFSEYAYTLYNGEGLRAFIDQHFDKEVVAAYDKLVPYAYKADLGRYCLLYQQGGWYADISILMRQTVTQMEAGIEIVYFWILVMVSIRVEVCLMFPIRLFTQSRGLLYWNERLKQWCHCQEEEHYGLSIYCPTGPSVLGAAIASQERTAAQVCGHLMALTPNHRRRNLSFVLPDGQILALFKKGWMDPDDVLFGKRAGTNNYEDLWMERRVYGES